MLIAMGFTLIPMARLARVVVEGLPHHVTQRGNRRQRVFFDDTDFAAYRALLAEGCASAGVEVWAYCLMPNHVHLILVPGEAGALRAALAEAHRRYSRRINFREGWRGYLWQGRFASAPMDEDHLLAGTGDGVARVAPLLERVGPWATSSTKVLAQTAIQRSRRRSVRDARLAARTLSRLWKSSSLAPFPAANPARSQSERTPIR